VKREDEAMASAPIDPRERERRLDEILGDYLAAAAAGQGPAPQELLARHPDFAGELAAFFADYDRLQRLANPLQPVAQAARASDPSTEPATEPTDADAPDAAPTGGGPTPTLAANGPVDDRTADFDEGAVPADGDQAELPRGTQVRYFGDYELRRVLGRGGMGVVYQAKQLSLNRLVALKMIRAGVLADEAELRRFQNEAEAVAALDHPGIVPIHEVGEHDGQRYFSMKLVPGDSLATRLDRYRDDPKATALLVAEAAEAVHHAHLRGILHRDLKPANILVDEQGHPHVTDFGLAKRVEADSELTQSGAILGTPAYMAPEQTTGHRGAVTMATDVYGLGAVLYALFAGKAPFGGDSVVETLDAVRTRPPEPPTRLNNNVSRDLEVICLKCLEKDPNRRYTSARALAEDLRRHLSGEPITARPVGPVQRAWMWCRRNKGIAALGALLLASLVAGTVFSLAFAFRARAESRRASQEAVHAGKEAERANEQADAARREREWSERLRYIAEINLAQRDWDAGNAQLARSRLADLAPRQPGALDLRGWEWFYFDAAFQPELRVLRGSKVAVASAAFAPDGKSLAWGCVDGAVRIWDTATGRELAILGEHQGEIWSVAFAPHGRTLAAAGGGGSGRGDRPVQIWDLASRSVTATLRSHRGPLSSVVFSPDGMTLATGGVDGTVRIWDTSSGRETSTLRGHQGRISSLAFEPDGERLASGGADGMVRVWSLATDRETVMLRGQEGDVISVAFALDGQTLASAENDGTVRIWDAGPGREMSTLRGHQNWVTSVAFAPDGRRLASTGGDQTVRIWDTTSGRETSILRGHQSEVKSVAFASDGRTLASGGDDRTVRIWDTTSGRETATLRGHQGAVSSVAFASDGRRLASTGYDGTVQIWNTASGHETATLRGHQGAVSSVSFAADGQTLATVGGDGTVQLWDLASGRETVTLRGHQGRVSSVAFAPDGHRLAAGGSDGTVRIWDTASGRETATLRGHQGAVSSVAFAPDGQTLATVGGDGTVQLWDAAPLTPERRVHREALSLVRLLLQRAAALADLRERIRRNPTVPEEVRARALELADGHWEAHVRHQAE
jgi:WD40 repeat protein/tRNA A-37 threonylcarbamoyl transferase component Bud32